MTNVTEKKKPRVMVWLLVATLVTGLLIVIGSIWDWTKIPVTFTSILWFVAIVVGVLFGLIYLGSPGSNSQQPTTAAGAHHPAATEAHAPAASAKKEDHGHGHMSKGQTFLYWSLGLLVLLLGVLLFTFMVSAIFGQDSSRGTGTTSSSRSVAHSSRLGIPADACTHVPVDAQLVVAPVGACSAPIVIDRPNTYGCSTPGQTSGLVRTKNWYGPTEPNSWESGNAPGDHTCVGSTYADKPVTVRFWTESYQPIP